MVRGVSMDLSHTTISRFLYGPNPHHTWAASTAKFDYQWEIVRTGAFGRNADQREAVISWLARHLALDGEREKWVAAPWLGIRKATFTLAAKFFWLLVRNSLSPTMADNIVTWDRAVMVAALVARMDINFPCLLLGELHERDFKPTTTYYFPCMIFQLCRDAGVPIWHCDKLVHATGTLDIRLIQDDTNVAAPRRGPRVDVPMGEDLIHTMGQMQGDGPPTTAPSNEHPTFSSQTASQVPSSSRATLLSGMTMIPLARGQKLEGQMATLLHQIKPWMRNLIVESEVRVEKRMEAKTDQKVQAVHKRLDAFELRVLERPAPTTDMSSFRTELSSLRADVDAILATPAVKPQAALSALGDDTVLGALFSGDDLE
uniref:Integrase core domain containing protein n=1 Tax=Solanum tuberosum TaxID=4113 RepID=M1DE30_SOLTU